MAFSDKTEQQQQLARTLREHHRYLRAKIKQHAIKKQNDCSPLEEEYVWREHLKDKERLAVSLNFHYKVVLIVM